MDAILASNYTDKDLDVVLCSNDSTALGVENSLMANYSGKWPIITGQDCDKPNVKNLVAGKQSMSIFKDTRGLAERRNPRTGRRKWRGQIHADERIKRRLLLRDI